VTASTGNTKAGPSVSPSTGLAAVSGLIGVAIVVGRPDQQEDS